MHAFGGYKELLQPQNPSSEALTCSTPSEAANVCVYGRLGLKGFLMGMSRELYESP